MAHHPTIVQPFSLQVNLRIILIKKNKFKNFKRSNKKRHKLSNKKRKFQDTQANNPN